MDRYLLAVMKGEILEIFIKIKPAEPGLRRKWPIRPGFSNEMYGGNRLTCTFWT